MRPLNREVQMPKVLSFNIRLPRHMHGRLDRQTELFLLAAWRRQADAAQTLSQIGDIQRELGYLIIPVVQLAILLCFRDTTDWYILFAAIQVLTLMLYVPRLARMLDNDRSWTIACKQPYEMQDFILHPQRAVETAPATAWRNLSRVLWFLVCWYLTPHNVGLSLIYLLSGLLFLAMARQARYAYPHLLETIRIQ